MGRFYNGVFEAVAVTVAQDLFELLAPADAVLIVHELELFQTTDLQDAAEEVLRLRTRRGVGSVTSGSGGSTVTTQPLSDGDPATGATLEANNTTVMAAGSGSIDTLQAFGWNIRIPFSKIWTPEMRPVVSPSNRFTFELVAAPTDSVTISGSITFEEIGG